MGFNVQFMDDLFFVLLIELKHKGKVMLERQKGATLEECLLAWLRSFGLT
jgi:hypothetical protein